MRVALTGGATGIGAAVASTLTAQGHHVTAFDMREPSASVAQWVPLDLSDPAAVAAAVETADGPFDASINNAGLPPREGLEQAILNVNFFGMKQFLEGMLDKLGEGASVVNVASRAGAQWRDNLEQVKALMELDPAQLAEFIQHQEITPTRAYNLSKEAVIVLTMAKTEAMIARGIRINSVSPAAVAPEFWMTLLLHLGTGWSRMLPVPVGPARRMRLRTPSFFWLRRKAVGSKGKIWSSTAG